MAAKPSPAMGAGGRSTAADALHGKDSKQFLKALKSLEDELRTADDQDVLLDEQLASVRDQLDTTSNELANRHHLCNELRAKSWDLEGEALASHRPRLTADGQQLAAMMMSIAMQRYNEAHHKQVGDRSSVSGSDDHQLDPAKQHCEVQRGDVA